MNGRGRWERPSSESTLAERFASRVGQQDANGCVPWLGAVGSNGYGSLQSGRSSAAGNSVPELAHRVAWRLAGLPQIPAGMTIDHLCRNRMCVNTAHMEIVTPGENSRRGAIKEVCKRGHRLAVSGVMTPSGYRTCKPCRDIRNAARFAA